LLSAKLLKHVTVKIYPGFPHGILITHADVINEDLPGVHPQLGAWHYEDVDAGCPTAPSESHFPYAHCVPVAGGPHCDGQRGAGGAAILSLTALT
jgi:hypothetical protein